MNILGISAFRRDSSAALLVDGESVAFALNELREHQDCWLVANEILKGHANPQVIEGELGIAVHDVCG